jgi:transposase
MRQWHHSPRSIAETRGQAWLERACASGDSPMPMDPPDQTSRSTHNGPGETSWQESFRFFFVCWGLDTLSRVILPGLVGLAVPGRPIGPWSWRTGRILGPCWVRLGRGIAAVTTTYGRWPTSPHGRSRGRTSGTPILLTACSRHRPTSAGQHGTATRGEEAKTQIDKWRSRFVARRLEGLVDEPRPGAPRKLTDEHIERVIVTTLETTPTDATHWSTRSLARALGMNQTAVSRIWRAFGLKPHLTEAFKLSTDPQFIDQGPRHRRAVPQPTPGRPGPGLGQGHHRPDRPPPRHRVPPLLDPYRPRRAG